MIHAYQYKVVTLFDCMQNPATTSWLEQFGLALPDHVPPGRYPTPLEIRGIMEGLASLRTAYLVGKSTWQVTLRHRKDVSWAVLAVEGFSGNNEEPHPFIFTGGWDEVILQATAALAKHCGPLVLLHESGARPQIVR